MPEPRHVVSTAMIPPPANEPPPPPPAIHPSRGAMFGMTYAGALGAFGVCFVCGALLADGDGARELHRRWHERIDTEGTTDG